MHRDQTPHSNPTLRHLVYLAHCVPSFVWQYQVETLEWGEPLVERHVVQVLLADQYEIQHQVVQQYLNEQKRPDSYP